MAIVALVNQKGGVGKTSTTMHLGGALARRGLKVLVVDNDPQSSLTKGLLGVGTARALDPATTIYALYAELPVPSEDLIRQTGFAGLSLLAGSPHAGDFNVPRPHRANPADQERLLDGLGGLAGRFDVVLVDSAPSLQLNTWAALVAADAALIPTQPELYGGQGLAEVRDWCYLVEKARGRAVPIAGIIVTMFNGRRAMHKLFAERLRAEYTDVLDSVIPEATEFPEAIYERKPIHWFKPRSAAARAIDTLATELMTRLNALGLVAPAGAKEVA
jgi:chromosome partitioning protein